MNSNLPYGKLHNTLLGFVALHILSLRLATVHEPPWDNSDTAYLMAK